MLNNASAAAAGAQQYSPRLRLTGQGWKTDATAASQTVDWMAENRPVQGSANPSSTLAFASQINAGGYADVMTLTSGGTLTVNQVMVGDVATPIAYLDVRGDSDTEMIAAFGDVEGQIYVSYSNMLNGAYTTNTDSAYFGINYRGYQNGTTRFRDLYIYNGKGSIMAQFDGSANDILLTSTLGGVTFAGAGSISVPGGGVVTITDLSASRLLSTNASNQLTSTNLSSWVSGTTNQITVTPSGGSVTLSTPQNIHTGATPTFAGLTLTGDLITQSGRKVKVTTTTLNTTLDSTYDHVLVTGTTTITLPAAASHSSRRYLIANAGSNTVTIARTGADTINGCTTASLINIGSGTGGHYAGIFFSDGANWYATYMTYNAPT